MFRQIPFTRYFIFIALIKLGSPAPGVVLTSDEAVRRAVEHSAWADYHTHLQSEAEGQIMQAGVRPNPVISAEVENFLGTGAFREANSLEATLGLRQQIERGGKREKRLQLARAEGAALFYDQAVALAELEAEVRGLFVEAQIARAQLVFAHEQEKLAAANVEALRGLVESARMADSGFARASLELEQQRLAVREARGAFDTAMIRLISFWEPSADPAGYILEGSMPPIQDPIPPLEDLAALLPETPVILRFDLEEARHRAAVALEEAGAKVDMEVFGGARYSNEGSGEGTFVAGVEIPWPVFDRNQGNIRSAQARLRAAEARKTLALQNLRRQLAAAHREVQAAQAEALHIETHLLPASEALLNSTQTGFERGQFSEIDVLATRREHLSIQQALLDAQARHARALADIQRLTRPARIAQPSTHIAQ